MLLTIKELSTQLQIKTSTLYAWAAQGRIPSKKINSLVRFDPEDIKQWLAAALRARPAVPRPRRPGRTEKKGLDRLIARAKQEAYNPAHGETRPTASPSGKEGKDGAR